MAQFEHDGICFHFEEAGSGVPFFFQHGLGGDVSQPFSFFQPPPGFRLISFDCRAHGQSHPVGPLEKIGLATFADDLLALLDHLKIAKAVVGGISMGAAVALNFTLRYPDRVLGLVLSRPAWLDAPNPWNVAMFSLITKLIRQHGAKRGLEFFRQSPEYQEALQRWPDVAQSLAEQFEDPEVEQTAFKFERIIRDTPSRDKRSWATIKAPTLVLANRLDPIHPFEYGELLAHAIPRAELREITAKTTSLEIHTADVQRCLEEFLTTHFARASTQRGQT